VSYLNALEKELGEFQIEVTAVQKQLLAAYCNEVSRWNQKINLTSLSGSALVRRLVIEPVWIARALSFTGSLVDIGSGNGSPAIPFHVVSRFDSCALIEARTKRAAFLRHLAVILKLSGVTVHASRFEDAATILQSPDWISLQAVALTDKLIESIRLIANRTTGIVWITADRSEPPDMRVRRTLTVPNTATRVFVCELDLT
jgi:16S rRNA (guanine(527)-N(7))-methyltransferase RsmG